MKIELRDIITRSELVTWKEMATLGDDESAYESMLARWQKTLISSYPSKIKNTQSYMKRMPRT